MQVRDAELELLKKRTYLNAASSFLFGMSTVLVSTATFTLFALLGNEFDAGKIFASLALFGNLSFPISFLPRVVNMVSGPSACCRPCFVWWRYFFVGRRKGCVRVCACVCVCVCVCVCFKGVAPI